MPKLTKKQKEAAEVRRFNIITMNNSGVFTQRQIAAKLRCSQQYVSKVVQKEAQK